LLHHLIGQHAADFVPVGADEGVGLVVRGHVDLDNVDALRFGALQLLGQQRHARILHDDHIDLVVDQRGQRLQLRGTVEIRIPRDVLHAAPRGLHLDHAAPFRGDRGGKRNRQIGDGLAFHRRIVVGAKFAGRLGPAFVLRLGNHRPAKAKDCRGSKNSGGSRQDLSFQHDFILPVEMFGDVLLLPAQDRMSVRILLRMLFQSPWRAVSSSRGCSQLSRRMAASSTIPRMMF